MARKPDRITVESDDGVFDRFSALTITNDIVGQTEARFELGDDGCWPELEELVSPGKPFKVYLNGLLRLTGRAEVNEVPASAGAGVTLQLTVRTKMADARYRSAPEGVRVENSSIKAFVLACYAPLGYAEKDFAFGAFAARDLLTGRAEGKGAPPDLEPIRPDQAKPQPGETIQAAVERHLARYHATHFDCPDGRIAVGVPDDTQEPIYCLRAKRGAASRGNNVLAFTRIRDWTDVARTVTVHGRTLSQEEAPTPLRSDALDTDVNRVSFLTGHFQRDIVVSGTQARSSAHAEAIAKRELSARIRRKSAFEFLVDGWTYWDGSQQIPWAYDTTVDVDVDALGREARGRFLVVRTILQLSSSQSATTQITVVAPGLWTI